MSRRLGLYLMAFGTVFFWGASFPLTKAALAWTGPTALAFLRWLISAVLLIAWLAAQRRLPQAVRLLRERSRTLVWVALIGITAYYFLENLSLRFTTATNAGVLSNLTPVLIMLIGAWRLHERMSGIAWAAVVAAFVGAGLVSLGAGHLSFGGVGLLGDALMVVAGFFGAAYTVGGKQLSERYPADVIITVVATLGALFLLPLAILEGLPLVLPPEAWGALLLLGLGSGALANLWWLSLLARITASRAALALFFIPVVSAVLAVTLLQEPVTPTIALGAALVLGGMLVAQRYT